MGHLKKIKAVDVNVSLFGLSKKWVINSSNHENLTYPANIDTVENDTIELPVLFKNKNRKNVSLLKMNDHFVLEDLFDKI